MNSVVDINTLGMCEVNHANIFVSKAVLVGVSDNIDCITLEDGSVARRSVSCLLKVLPGDGVLVIKTQEENYILNILTRDNSGEQVVEAVNASSLCIKAKNMEFFAEKNIRQVAGKNIELSAPLGQVIQQARRMVLSASDSMIQLCRRFLLQSKQNQTEAEELMTMRVGQGLIESKNEIRLEAKHINMG